MGLLDEYFLSRVGGLDQSLGDQDRIVLVLANEGLDLQELLCANWVEL